MPVVDVLDSTLHYEEVRSGADPDSGPAVVLLHGNPGSSHVWRHVLPGIGPGRLLAPDLIGMGRSGKPDIPYDFADHARYLDAWFDTLGLDRVVLVGHDWGGALAFDRAARHPGRVAGIAFLESIVRPVARADLSPQARRRSEMVLAPGAEETLLGEDVLVRMAFTGAGVLNPVSDEDLAAYLAPYRTRADRRPLLAWARQIPLDGEPAAVVARIEAFGAWLAASSQVPKLLMTFEGSPTLLVDKATADWCAEHVAALETVPCGEAAHHAPEDQPAAIAAAVLAWRARHGLL
ncbi:haloalkane dehalogenase [Streptomyces sp. V4-01]|uniref:Haloalkane dehalogenase n=1 Tax=Actinacidiphila polyblastidii TaxID=3110430 RepID=A0ABU7P9I3_9ACTN|nr:haloalkane dehalogenase [Streptomyces sp. V4-01]